MRNFLATRWGIICVGGLIGVFAALLQKWGNPGNMGICVACFERDIAGAVGLHRAHVVQYMRPEILGFVFGALIAAFSFRDFRPRAGSAPIVRFVLGMWAMIGALVFLGCPWRAMLRLAGGDGTAILGLLGLVFGIIKAGFIISIILLGLNAFGLEEAIIPPREQEKSKLYTPVREAAPMIFDLFNEDIDQLLRPGNQNEERISGI